MDVNNAFLHGTLSEQVYCQQPVGFVDAAKPDHVCLLDKSLYGLKQAPRAWFARFAAFVHSIGFVSSRADPSLFVLNSSAVSAYLLLYVDDIILATSTTTLLHHLQRVLSAEFSMKDLGPLHYFLGIAVMHTADGFFFSQRKYTEELLDCANMQSCKPALTPVDTRSKLSAHDGAPVPDASVYRSIVGALQYMMMTRPDIAYAIQQCCLATLLWRSACCATSAAPPHTDYTCDAPPSLSSSRTLTRTGPAAQTRAAPPADTLSSSVTRSSPGRPNARQQCPAQAPKLNIAPSPTPSSRTAGFISLRYLCPRRAWYSATTSRRFTWLPTPFTTGGPNTSSSTSISFARRSPSASSGCYMSLLRSSSPTCSPRGSLLQRSKNSGPVCASVRRTLQLRRGVSS
ncbi:hypothetical protein VPH35_032990 [Triticum aestivum]